MLELPEAEEAQALLAEALEFIDAYELSDRATVTDSAPSQAAAASVKAPPNVETALSVTRSTTKRVRDTREYERRRRGKKKAERELLRKQALDYEAQLELLQLSRQIPDRRVSYEIARRREAEQQNLELRKLLAERFKMTEEIAGFLTNAPAFLARVQTTLQHCPLPAPHASLQPRKPHAAIVAELRGMVPQLFDSTELMLAEAFTLNNPSVSEAIWSSSRVKQDDSPVGLCAELSTCTPMACALDVASAVLWGMRSGEEWFGEKRLQKLENPHRTNHSVELEYTMDFGDPSRSMVVDGASWIERREEEHRVVVAWASMVIHPSGQPFVRTKGWIVITRSSTNPLQASIVRTCSVFEAVHASLKGVSDAHWSGRMPFETAQRQSLLASACCPLKVKMDRLQQAILKRVAAANMATRIAA